MTLAELWPTIYTPAKGYLPRGVSPEFAPQIVAKCRRQSWKGRAYVETVDGVFMIHGNRMSITYCPSFEDLMADDWEAVEG